MPRRLARTATGLLPAAAAIPVLAVHPLFGVGWKLGAALVAATAVLRFTGDLVTWRAWQKAREVGGT